MCLSLFLADVFIHLRDSSHTYVEVILHGKTEGQFLEDRSAHGREKMGDVSKLGGSWQCVVKR